MIALAASACLLLGCVILLLGAFGLLRLPDFFSRTHAASMTDTAGAGFILIGLMLIAGANLISVKLLLTLIFLLATAPTAGHALAQAALADGQRPIGKIEKEAE